MPVPKFNMISDEKREREKDSVKKKDMSNTKENKKKTMRQDVIIKAANVMFTLTKPGKLYIPNKQIIIMKGVTFQCDSRARALHPHAQR